ncbi:class I SAM-dependent methyltransferase [Patescibacteria group bacterium]|nr:class I SAM-dependent methyltransferase [Patescibacteria group bacterium]MBU4099531.1 class I SAM-dependent methyltransferase [Patescibacteria group bacterium]
MKTDKLKILNNRNLLTQKLRDFLCRYNATLLGIQESKRDNFERLPAPGNGLLHCFTVSVLFHNIGIFGKEGDYLDEIYPRLAALHMQLTNYLKKRDIEINGPNTQIAITIIPYADPYGTLNKSMPLYIRESRGQKVITSETLSKKSPYYANLIQKYSACSGVVTNNGTVVGPDGGLIGAACKVASTYPNKIRVLELGSGGGSTALALAIQNKIQSYLGNDFSPEMITHFQTEVAPQLTKYSVKSSVTFGSCFEFPLKNQVDLISIGVYFQTQPSLFEKRGHELVKCLDKSGVLIVQSGMLEDPFVTTLLSGSMTNNSIWPWYKKSYHLNNYFTYVSEYAIEQETVLITTNNLDKFQQITKLFIENNGFKKLSIANKY